MDQDTRNSIQQLREVLTKVGALTPKMLVRQDELGAHLNFASSEQTSTNILILCATLSAIPDNRYEYIPAKIIDSFHSRVLACLNAFNRLTAFRPGTNNPTQERDAIIQEIRGAYHSLSTAVLPYVSYLQNDSEAIPKLTAQANEELIRVRKVATDFEAEKNKVLRDIREAAGQVGVEVYARDFEKQADEYKTAANRWLAATWLLAVVGVGVFYAVFFGPHKIDASVMSTPEVVYAAISRIIITSLIYSGVFLSNQNYTANRHNYIVNKHRQNALGTFKTFVNSAGNDVQVKNAVLLHASQSIFAPQITGYQSNEAPPSIPANIIEIAKKTLPPENT